MDRQKDRKTERYIDRQKNRQEERNKYRSIDGQSVQINVKIEIDEIDYR